MILPNAFRVLLGALFIGTGFFLFTVTAQAAACPVTDGGGGDGDATADGTITISSNTTWTPTDGTAWDCTGVDILVTSSSTLTFGSDLVNGYIGNLSTDNLQIDNGSAISSNEKGCTNTTTNGTSFGPDASNICASNGLGVSVSQGANDDGSPGGSHGGIGGVGGTTKTYTLGTAYDDPVGPVKFGNSGTTVTTTRSAFGGTGGGVVKVTLTGTLTLNGDITVNGGAGTVNEGYNQAAGGGAGGSIFVTMDTLTGAGGSFVASGGNGAEDTTGGAPPDGGGGGGGMVSLHYNTNSYTGLPTLTVAGGTGPNEADDGAAGSVVLKDVDDSSYNVMHGFVWDDTDHTGTTWTFNANADSQTCAAGTTTPSLTAGTLTYAGTLVCNPGSLTSFNLAATTSFSIAEDTSLTVTDAGSTIDFDIPTSNDQTFANLDVTGSERGAFTIDDAVGITLEAGAGGNSVIAANVNWSALTAFTMNADQTISANGLGCDSDSNPTTGDGYGPDGSNVCTATTAGYGPLNNSNSESNSGAGHGGAGGAGTTAAGGATYGSSTAPVLFGSSGGGSTRSDDYGGTGGGAVRIHVNGNASYTGTISADAANDALGGTGYDRWGGGGSGGSIYISTTGTHSGAATFSADGGDGEDDTGGGGVYDGAGGGGGRVSIVYGKDGSGGSLASLGAASVAAAGTSPDGGGNDGVIGSLNVSDGYGPSISSSATADSDNDGQIDQVILTMNEDIDGGSIAGADFTVTGYTVASASRTADSQVTIVLTESGSGDTDATPSTSISGSIDDTSANSTTSGSSTPTDNAKPILESVTPASGGDADLASDDIVLVFSEPMVASFVAETEYSISPSLAGLSTAFSNSNKTVTISHDDFVCGTDYTVTTTEAEVDAAAGVGDLNTGATLTGDWTFSSPACSSSSAVPSAPRTFGVGDTNSTTSTGGNTSTDGPSVTVAAGTTSYQVTWENTGTVRTNHVNIYVSYDGGETYTLAAAAIKNDGSYDLSLADGYFGDVRVKVALTDLAVEVASGQVARFRLGEPPAGSTTVAPTRSFSQPETFTSPVTGVVETVEQVQPGAYITSPSFDTVYLITEDGQRRPFMDAQTFFTYEDGFDNVIEVSDATLPTLNLGSPVLPQAGVVLVKVESDPRVYTIEDGGVLRWIQTENMASLLYGVDWADYVIDVPATMFPRFEFGDPVEEVTEVTANILIMKPRFRLVAKVGK